MKDPGCERPFIVGNGDPVVGLVDRINDAIAAVAGGDQCHSHESHTSRSGSSFLFVLHRHSFFVIAGRKPSVQEFCNYYAESTNT